MLISEHLSFGYGGGARVIADLTHSFAPGQYHAIVGPNGSGKSTLFSLLCGSVKPDGGRVTYGGRDVHQMPARTRAQAFATLYQQAQVHLPFTCLEVVLMGLYPRTSRFERVTRESLAAAQAQMALTGIEPLMNRPFSSLSGGEKQRVSITRALMQRPHVLFLDEAMSELDINARLKMAELIRREVVGPGGTVIAVHHDLSLAYRYADRVIALADGRIVADGHPHEVMDERFFADVFHVQAEILPGRGFFLQNSL